MRDVTKPLATLLSLVLLSAQAVAQTPDIADALRQIPAAPAISQQEPLPSIVSPTTQSQTIPLESGQTISISRLILEDSTVIPEKEIAAFLDPFADKETTIGELQSLARRLTEWYQQQGYITSRVVIPAQDISGGVVRLKALEGGYGTMTLNNTSLVATETLAAITEPLQDEEIVALKDIEGALQAVSSRAGVIVENVEIARGNIPQSSDFIITTTPAARLSGYAIVDNYGSAFTGKNRASGRVELASPTGIGDKLSLSGLITNGQYLENYQAAYTLPIAANGLTAGVAVSRTTYQLTSTFSSLDATGVAESFEASVSYPFIETRDFSLNGTITAEHRDLVDEIQSTSTIIPKSIDAVTAELLGIRNDTFLSYPNALGASIAMTWGNLDIQDAVAAAQDRLGAQTEGDYAKINVSLSHKTTLSTTWEIVLSLRAQQALQNKNLDGSEDFSISGINAVNAYPSWEFAAENAFFQSVEARYSVPEYGHVQLTLAPFFEMGRAMVENKTGSNTAQTLSATGFNVYTTYGDFFATTTLAQRLSSKATSEKVPERLVLMNGGVRF